jgi:hypothetical protein
VCVCVWGGEQRTEGGSGHVSGLRYQSAVYMQPVARCMWLARGGTNGHSGRTGGRGGGSTSLQRVRRGRVFAKQGLCAVRPLLRANSVFAVPAETNGLCKYRRCEATASNRPGCWCRICSPCTLAEDADAGFWF